MPEYIEITPGEGTKIGAQEDGEILYQRIKTRVDSGDVSYGTDTVPPHPMPAALHAYDGNRYRRLAMDMGGGALWTGGMAVRSDGQLEKLRMAVDGLAGLSAGVAAAGSMLWNEETSVFDRERCSSVQTLLQNGSGGAGGTRGTSIQVARNYKGMLLTVVVSSWGAGTMTAHMRHRDAGNQRTYWAKTGFLDSANQAKSQGVVLMYPGVVDTAELLASSNVTKYVVAAPLPAKFDFQFTADISWTYAVYAHYLAR